MSESDWATIWEVVPPDVKTLFEEKLGSRPARKMAARARLVCSSWAASLAFPVLRVSNYALPEGSRFPLLDGAKRLSWVRPPRNLSGLTCAKNLRALCLNYLVLIFDPEAYASSLMLDDLLRGDDSCPALLEHLSITCCTLKAEEFRHVGRLRALKSLYLSDATIDDGALRHMSSLEGLATLDISNNSRVTDAGLAALPRRLTALNVSQCNLVTDAGLAALPKGLESLDLSNCNRVTDAGLGHLGRLATLKINYCARIDGSGLASLRDVRSLSAARLGWDTLSYFGFKLGGLERLSRLSSLDVSGIRIEEEMSIPTLTSLEFRCGSGSGLARLRLPALADLCVYGTRVSAADLKPFGRTLTSLKAEASLKIAGGLRELGDNLPALSSLKLVVSSDNFGGLDYSAIKTHFPALTSLDVSGLGIKDGDLAHLGHLSSLNLSFCQSVTSAGLPHLAGLSSVLLTSCPGVKDKMAIEELWKIVEHVEF